MKFLTFAPNTILLRKNRAPFVSKGAATPVIRVNSNYVIQSGCSKHQLMVNNAYVFPGNAVEIITEDFAEKLINLWNKLSISETRFTETSHYRTDSQKEKVPIDKSEWRSILFQYIVRHFPDFDLNNLPYAVYVCPVCSSLHLGKTDNLHASP